MEFKISIIMQCYLDSYNDSRSDSVLKFERVIESFKKQKYKNCELIIVSDGCSLTKKVYEELYKNIDNIKFAYYDRTGYPKMYDIVETPKGRARYFRGKARGIGCSIASGDIITYMDSDDYLTPEFTLICNEIYKRNKNKTWFLNTSWYDHENVVNSKQNINALKDPKNIESIQLEVLKEHKFKKMECKDGKAIMAPWLLIHKNNISTKWKDSNSNIGSEDVDFYNRLVKEYPNGIYFKHPIYIRCHYKDLWDI